MEGGDVVLCLCECVFEFVMYVYCVLCECADEWDDFWLGVLDLSIPDVRVTLRESIRE